MLSLVGKTMVVIGGSRGVGRQIVDAAHRNGARVLAVARQEEQLSSSGNWPRRSPMCSAGRPMRPQRCSAA